MDDKILEIKKLKTYFYSDGKVVKAVDGIDLEINSGETLGLVGESGSGKSVTSLSVMGLIPEPTGRIVDGQILFQGRDLTELSKAEMRKIMGNDISMIFQDPMTSLNPVFTIGEQLCETIILHKKIKKKEALKQSIEMLKKVGIPQPEMRVNEYPHQLSGGMRQRIMIAMALSCNPQLLIADEPTTALDVTIQAQILDLINDLKKKYNTAILMITHDLGVVAEVSDKVGVMYAGNIVEYAEVEDLFSNPCHPYTIGLLNSIPKLDETVERLTAIPGIVPNPLDFPEGCRFHTRCAFAENICREKYPELEELRPGHKVRCWNSHRMLKSSNE